jgi:hypothetical protein
MAVSGVFTGRRTIDGRESSQPSAISVRFGLTSWIMEGLYVKPSITYGVSGPIDRFLIGPTIPYAF